MIDAATVQRLGEWKGRTETAEDVVTAAPVRALAATLDRERAPLSHGERLPPLWHWLYFLPAARQSTLGDDGHPTRGGFLPPVPLPRRMWAGSRLAFHAPLAIGEAIRRESTIADVRHKQGRSGELVFVVVRHDVHGRDGLAITEEQQIVYRGASTSPAPAAATAGDAAVATRTSQWSRTVAPDPVLLFRYSALTFNGHRIHYDRPYATGVEGYPGLVVHGPLLATLLLEALGAALPGHRVATFEFTARKPVFDLAPFAVSGTRTPEGAALWASDASGAVAMDATASFASGPDVRASSSGVAR